MPSIGPVFKTLVRRGYRIDSKSHADAILSTDFRGAAEDIVRVLSEFSVKVSELVGSGGGETTMVKRLREGFGEVWKKEHLMFEREVAGAGAPARTHEIDHVRHPERRLALEVEWNNKDTFFDRDLENFRNLHSEGTISVGIIITRGPDLEKDLPAMIERFIERHDIKDPDELVRWGAKKRTDRQLLNIRTRMLRDSSLASALAREIVSDKFSASTTNWTKLQERVGRGLGSPCPLLLLGIPQAVLIED